MNIWAWVENVKGLGSLAHCDVFLPLPKYSLYFKTVTMWWCIINVFLQMVYKHPATM